IKAKVYQLNPEQTLFIGGLARLDFVKGERTSFVCYFSNELNIHRTKLENANQLYENHVGDMLQPPSEESLKQLPKLQKHTFHINGKTDIVFSGLGWVTVTDGEIEVVAHIPE